MLIMLDEKNIGYEDVMFIKGDKLISINWIDNGDLLSYLNTPIKSTNYNFTLQDLFNRIQTEGVGTFQTVFNSHLGRHNIVNFIDEMNENLSEEEASLWSDMKIKYIEIKAFCDLHSSVNKDGNSFELSFGCDGAGEDGVMYGLSLVPLSLIKDIPIKINNVVHVTNWHISCNPLADKKEDDSIVKDVFVGNLNITLYDYLSAIFNEISFYGYKENKISFMSELREAKEDIDSGQAKLVDFKTLFENN